MDGIKCLFCADVLLADDRLDDALLANRCARCGGSWVTGQTYWDWLERQQVAPQPAAAVESPGGASATADTAPAKRCLDCGHFLTHAKVGHGVAFHIDRC